MCNIQICSFIDPKTASLLSDETPEFEVRQPYSSKPSEWMPAEAQLQSAFSEASSQTIVANGYEHPDVQLVKLKNGGVFMAFLDTDMTKGITERTVLKYSVYQNGAWSDPRVVQDDSTCALPGLIDSKKREKTE